MGAGPAVPPPPQPATAARLTIASTTASGSHNLDRDRTRSLHTGMNSGGVRNATGGEGTRCNRKGQGTLTRTARTAADRYACGRPMDETEPAGLSPRALRGMALIALALVVMAVG